jgi:uncharacterized protein YceK
MRVSRHIALVLVVALGGCNKTSALDESAPGHHGRYTGIGIYSADRLWAKMTGAEKPKDSAAATTEDDRTIIVVVDSETGEVRQCGNMSGHCIGMNPWAGPLAKLRNAPVSLTKHAADLDSEEAEAANDTAPAAKAPPRR